MLGKDRKALEDQIKQLEQRIQSDKMFSLTSRELPFGELKIRLPTPLINVNEVKPHFSIESPRPLEYNKLSGTPTLVIDGRKYLLPQTIDVVFQHLASKPPNQTFKSITLIDCRDMNIIDRVEINGPLRLEGCVQITFTAMIKAQQIRMNQCKQITFAVTPACPTPITCDGCVEINVQGVLVKHFL